MAKGKHEAPKKTNKTESAKSTAAKKSGGAKKAVLITVIVIAVLAAAAFGGGCLAGRSDKIHPNLTLGSVAPGRLYIHRHRRRSGNGHELYRGCAGGL